MTDRRIGDNGTRTAREAFEDLEERDRKSKIRAHVNTSPHIIASLSRIIAHVVHSSLGDATHMAIHTEKIMEDAEVASIYIRALIDRGVPMQSAIGLTASYISARQPFEYKEPREPWQSEDTAPKPKPMQAQIMCPIANTDGDVNMHCVYEKGHNGRCCFEEQRTTGG